MNVDEKIKQFSDVVIREAETERDAILSRVAAEYEKSCGDFKKELKQKYDRRFEEERNRAKREAQKKIVVAQSDLKRQLIAKRTDQIESIMKNVLEKISKYIESDKYINILIKQINENKAQDFNSVVYLVERDMKHKERIEDETGVLVMQSGEDFIGGMKITVSENRIIDCSFKTKLDEEKENFNKIRIY